MSIFTCNKRRVPDERVLAKNCTMSHRTGHQSCIAAALIFPTRWITSFPLMPSVCCLFHVRKTTIQLPEPMSENLFGGRPFWNIAYHIFSTFSHNPILPSLVLLLLLLKKFQRAKTQHAGSTSCYNLMENPTPLTKPVKRPVDK